MTVKEQWHKIWMEGTKNAKALRRITKMKRKGNKTGLKLYDDIINRDAAAIIVQLRMGHCGLNHYLHRFGINRPPYCECGYGKETVDHFLLEYRKCKEPRKKAVGAGKMKVGILLGDPVEIKHTMAFVKATERLNK
jgi:hypothetical protein